VIAATTPAADDGTEVTPRTVVLAYCPACGEQNQETFADQWIERDPRCGFCGVHLARAAPLVPTPDPAAAVDAGDP
jgi:hypothetical protein